MLSEEDEETGVECRRLLGRMYRRMIPNRQVSQMSMVSVSKESVLTVADNPQVKPKRTSFRTSLMDTVLEMTSRQGEEDGW
jgi:hypothetical protein